MIAKEELKQKLLGTDLFIDNEYLEQYLELVYNPTKITGYTEKHHVIPAVYYKHLYNCNTRDESEKIADLDINNFIATLQYRDHCKAHWLLYFCTKDYLKYSNDAAIRYIVGAYKKLTGKDKHKLDFVQEDFDLLQKYMNDIIKDENSRYYSEEENNILRQYYPEQGLNYCMKLLPNRSKTALYRQARKLGLKYTAIYWTEEEESLLKLNYPIYGVKYCMKLLNRTKLMIKCKANAMGLKVIVKNKYNQLWTAAEDEILLKYYEEFGVKYCAELLPNRTITAISKRASDTFHLHMKRTFKQERQERLERKNKDENINRRQNKN